jgi:uncharacterized membrane protein YphA (DoxX/SURF4 family)
MKNMKKNVIVEIISFLFILLFVYAGGSKLLDYQKFVVQIGQSAMLTRWAGVMGWFIPILEVGLAVMLIFKRTQKVALYGALNLMVVFTTYIFIVMNFTPNVPCSCGGILERMGWTEHFYFNLAFIFLAIIALALNDSVEQGELILESK